MRKQQTVDHRRRALLGAGGVLILGAMLQPARLWGQGGSPGRIGIIGSGHIGGTIGGLWIKKGHPVMFSLRDQMGIAGGVKNLPWLFTATFVTLLAAQPLYGALVARLPRARFIPIVYHFFVANIVLFLSLIHI